MDSRNPNSFGSDVADASQIGAVRSSIDRNEFFAGLFFLGSVNGIAAKAIAAVHRVGWLDAMIGTFDVSALVLIALPIGGLSWIAVSGLALYILLFTDADPPMRRGALILLAATMPMLWSRL